MQVAAVGAAGMLEELVVLVVAVLVLQVALITVLLALLTLAVAEVVAPRLAMAEAVVLE
jgi:hypothetical protein